MLLRQVFVICISRFKIQHSLFVTFTNKVVSGYMIQYILYTNKITIFTFYISIYNLYVKIKITFRLSVPYQDKFYEEEPSTLLLLINILYPVLSDIYTVRQSLWAILLTYISYISLRYWWQVQDSRPTSLLQCINDGRCHPRLLIFLFIKSLQNCSHIHFSNFFQQNIAKIPNSMGMDHVPKMLEKSLDGVLSGNKGFIHKLT